MFQSLLLKNFRNFDEVSVPLSPQINIFLGNNGQGKTNLLEALYLISNGDSFRYADNENFLKKGFNESFLKARAVSADLDFDLELTILKSRKNHLLNKKRVTGSELSKKFPSVVFSPESLSAIKDGADQRRQLIDEILVSFRPANADLIGDFKKALKTRNRILKNYVSGESDRKQTELLMESLFPSFLKLSTDLTWQRLEALRAIHGDVNNAMQYVVGSDSQIVDISVEYVASSENLMPLSREEVEKRLRKRFNELFDAELASGASLVGPQRHDVVFLYNENDSRFYCSQGQQRALILSFKMAQIVYHRKLHGIYPMLMLDDVMSELDSLRRDSLTRFLSEIKTQIFITTIDFTLPISLKSEDCVVFRVREG